MFQEFVGFFRVFSVVKVFRGFQGLARFRELWV